MSFDHLATALALGNLPILVVSFRTQQSDGNRARFR